MPVAIACKPVNELGMPARTAPIRGQRPFRRGLRADCGRTAAGQPRLCSMVTAVLRAAEVRAPQFASLEGIIAAVCSEFGVTVDQLASPSRERYYARARCLAAALVRQTPGLTMQSLSRAFNRHYATLYRSLELALEDPEFWEQLRQIEERLEG